VILLLLLLSIIIITINSVVVGDSLLTLYFASVRSKLEYASVAWNTITSSDARKFVHIQQKFLALHHNRLFPQIYYI
jgi:hypothetical protein